MRSCGTPCVAQERRFGRRRPPAANDFALIDRLWSQWSPGYRRSDRHRAEVNAGLAAGGEVPLDYYRSIFPDPTAEPDRHAHAVFGPVPVPALSMMGADDGCISAGLLAGQEAFWSAPVDNQVVDGCGHFLHLERPDVVAGPVIDFLRRGSTA